VWGRPSHRAALPAAKPVLDLSGPRLTAIFEHLVAAAEPEGGIERYVGALWLKHSLFAERLGDGRAGDIGEAAFCDLCAFVTPARRRIGRWLARHGFAEMRERLARLFAGFGDAASADRRLAEFVAGFPADREHRWARDLGAEALHFTMPERYPLMTRWMWDARTNTGVLREIWHAEDVDAVTIAAADDFLTFATLREELDGFLSGNGVFRDLPFYGDLLCAHVYAFYINGRGGSYLRTDFSAREDPMAHTRRLLGLDAVASEKGRTRLKLLDGTAHVLAEPVRLTGPPGRAAI
jgi:hypothetical protein